MWRTFSSVARPHIVAIGAAGTFTFGWLFTGVHPWGLAAVAGLDWFLVNLLNRAADLPEDRANAVAGADFVARRWRALTVTGAALLVGSLVLVHALAPALTPLRLFFHAVGVAYNWPVLPGRRRVKELYFWKNTASATGFVVTLFAYPLAHAGWSFPFPPGIGWAAVAVSVVFFFLFELSYEVLYDLRDVAGDAAAGVRTYPVVHGVPCAVHIVDGLLAASFAALVLGYASGLVPWRLAVMASAPALQLAYVKRALRRGGPTSADCVVLTWLGAGLLVAYHLWIAAGLPGAGV